VVSVIDYGTTPAGLPFLVLELLVGPTLREALDADGAFAPARAADLARQIALGLKEAHGAGLVHRDLKPENVILVRQGAEKGSGETAKILDFGTVRLLENDDADIRTQLTQGGNILGTPGFMSPEQISDPANVGPEADLYALGAVLYTMLAGRAPFSGTPLDVVDLQLTTDPPPLDENGALGALATRMIARDPRMRPDGIDAVLAELRSIGFEDDTAPRPAPIEGVPDIQIRQGASASMIAFALIVAAALIASTTIAAYLLRPNAARPEPAVLLDTTSPAPLGPTVHPRAEVLERSAEAIASSEKVPEAAGQKIAKHARKSAVKEARPAEPSAVDVARLQRSVERALAAKNLTLVDLEEAPTLAPLAAEWRTAVATQDGDVIQRAHDELTSLLSTLAIDSSLVKRRLRRVNQKLRQVIAAGPPERVGGLEERFLDLRSTASSKASDPEALLERIASFERELDSIRE
jgi:serine/threonine-protein kinase